MYPMTGVMLLMMAAMLFGGDGWNGGEILTIVALGLVGVATWWVLKFRPTPDVPDSAAVLESTLRASRQYTLLAFESEYCPICTASDVYVRRLEAIAEPGLTVLRLSVQREPGRTLFKQHDGRLTPAFVLLGPDGKAVQDWLIVLPIDRVLFAVRTT
jgi:hypothetical protein